MAETQPATLGVDTQPADALHEANGAHPYGRLVPLNHELQHVDLWEREFTIGRRTENKLTFADPRISGHHCRLFVEPGAGNEPDAAHVVWIEDTSANGTFVNGKRVGRNKRRMLVHGDAISLVVPHSAASDAIAYMFHDVSKRARMQESEIERDYDLREELGRGNFASVRLGVRKTDGKRVAIKVIDKKKSLMHAKPGDRDVLADEVNILRSLDHDHIIRIHDVFDTPDTMYLVLELVTGGELFDRIVAKRKYAEADARTLLAQMLEALRYLHDRGIAHRDLKPENILLVSKDDDTTIKLSDFGVSRVIDADMYMSTICGTPQYLAPEILLHAKHAGGYGKACDLWSVGVILYILLCGFPPFSESEDATLYQCIAAGRYSFPSPWWDGISSEAKDLVSRLLTVDAGKRITIPQCFEHAWLAGHKLPDVYNAASPTSPTSTPAASNNGARATRKRKSQVLTDTPGGAGSDAETRASKRVTRSAVRAQKA